MIEKVIEKVIKNVILLIALAALLPGSPRAASLADLEFEYLSIGRGLSQSGVYDILQDSNGFMWFATQSGLNKYDGVKFTLYRNRAADPNSISHDWIRCLYEDRQGRLWIGTHGGGLNRFDPETETFTRYTHGPDSPKGLSSNFILDICLDSEDILWVSTFFGLNRLDLQSNEIKRVEARPDDPEGLPDQNVLSMCNAPDGYLWLAHGKGLSRIKPGTGRFVNYFHKPGAVNGLRGEFTGYVYVDRDGFVWVESGGLSRLDPATGKFTHFDENAGLNLKNTFISAIFRDRDGLVWLGTHLNGVFVLNPENDTFHWFNPVRDKTGGLNWNSIRVIHEDRTGIIRIGTGGAGVNIVDKSRKKFKLWNRPPGSGDRFSHYSLHAIFEDRRGILWLSSSAGGLTRLDRQGSNTRHLLLRSPKDKGRPVLVRAIAGESDGKMWLGTFRRGIYEFDPLSGAYKPYLPNPEQNGIVRIRSLLRGRDGMLWLGCDFGRFFRFNPADKTFTRYRHDPNTKRTLRPYAISALHQDRAGDIWLGTNGRGLLKFDRENKSFTRYRAGQENPNGLNDNDIYAILEDTSGRLWIGTSGGGLNMLERLGGKASFQHFTTAGGLADDVIYGILEDEKHHLWLSTNRGISRFDPVNRAFKNYDIRDGLQGYEYNLGAYFKSSSGEMFFGGINGLNMFFPAAIKTNTNKPPVVITGFNLFHKPVAIGGGSPLKKHIGYTRELTLSHRDNTFSFQFAALDFTHPGHNQYKYKIEGLHRDWIYLGYENRVSITGLEPGQYVLRVNGSNNDGVWNDKGVSITVRIKPPYWRTWWFRILAVSILAGLALLWHRRRMHHATLQLKTEAQLNKLFAKYGISEREQEVLRLVLQGKTNVQIEDELYIALPTVKKHIYHIYKKMNVNTRLELINAIQRSLKNSFQ